MKINSLIQNKGFLFFFWTQFLGAMNDNFFKNALVVLVTYKGVQIANLGTEQIVALSGALFVLPFFLFSPLAGQLSDKFEKSHIIRLTKLWEIIIMICAAVGFIFDQYAALLLVLFLMGAQSAFFGPVKYSAIPELVEEKNLTTGNAFVESGTFVAILMGTILGGWFTTFDKPAIVISFGVVSTAILGYISARGVPTIRKGDPQLKIELNPMPEFKNLYRLLLQNRVIADSVLGISWFWFFGAGVISVLPIYVKNQLGGGESVITLFLAMFTIGIGLGSFVCERLSFHKVELGLVPFGSLGITIFLLDLSFLNPISPTDKESLFTLSQFMAQPLSARIAFDFFMMSLFGGLFILPLYTLLQERSDIKNRSRVIAANNIANALFMVVSSVLILFCYQFNLSTTDIFLTLAILNFIISTYMYFTVPEFTLRFYTWILSNIFYNVKVKGRENLPQNGPYILAANHVTYIDWLIISGACPRPARFVMWVKFFEIPIIKSLLKQAKVIPIASALEDSNLLHSAFNKISKEINSGHIVCFFPEGRLTTDGKLCSPKPGLLQVVKNNPCPVVPIYVEGLWGSLLSKKKNKQFHFRRKVYVHILPPISASDFTTDKWCQAILGQALPK